MADIEHRLIRQAQQGNQEALATIYDSFYPAIFRYIYYRISDQECAEDMAAEVFVRMLENIGHYEVRSHSFLAWLYTIAHHLVVDYYRKQAEVNVMPLEESRVMSDSYHPAQIVEHHASQECLAKALTHLTEDQRQVVLLKFIEEYDISEVAAIMGKQERAIRSLQHRALATLHRVMEQEGRYVS
jgi:RNA polymerase sigma-70 factor (ECF subfamily)